MNAQEAKGNCPKGCDLTGGEIPKESLEKGYYGKWDGKTPQYYSRVIGVEIPGEYDGVLYWMCPDCGSRWHRFSFLSTPRLWGAAEEYVREMEVTDELR